MAYPLSTRCARRTPVGLLLGLTLAAAAGHTHAAEPVSWRTAPAAQDVRVVDLAGGLERLAPAEQFRRVAQQPDTSRMIVRFDAPPSPEQRDALEASGLNLLSPLGGATYFAAAAPGADADAIAAAGLRSATDIRPHQKLEQTLFDGQVPGYAVVRTADAQNPNVTAGNPIVTTYVVLHRDAFVGDDDATRLISAYGGVVRDVVLSVNAAVVELPADQIKALAQEDAVQWIEPPLPRMGTFNATNRAITQTDIANSAPYNLDGSGVTAFVYDGGTARNDHTDFSGRVTLIDGDSWSFHATHVAGTVGGDGSTTFAHRGMAPAVSILSAGFEWDGSGTFFVANPGDIEADYATALANGADLSNNSIGANVSSNFLPCSLEGDYGVASSLIDAIIAGSLGDSLVIFWAAGNERGSGFCGTLFETTPPPANNKNAITIGALNADDDSITSFTSFGPSDDGRVRPVLSAPGCQIGGDGGITSTDSGSSTAYNTLCGTSMAAPTAAGMGALLIQDYRAQYPGLGDPSNQLVKAFMIQAATDIDDTGPDYRTGYGSIKIVDTIEFMRTGLFDEDTVGNGEVAAYTVDVQPGASELKMTLTWDDPAAAPNTLNTLINDLDLVVLDPNGVRHFPWTLNPANPDAPAVKTQEDHLNNIEQVQVNAPIAGTWTVEVRGTNVADGPQGFALVGTPDLSTGPRPLFLSFDSSVPGMVLPGTPIDVQASIVLSDDTLTQAPVLYYRHDGGAFVPVPMSDLGGFMYEATVPGADCDETIEFYVEAVGDLAGSRAQPTAGAASPFTTDIGEILTIASDNFETDPGYTVSGDATDGQWELGVPLGNDRSDPPTDADGSGSCWLTDNDPTTSNSDVDNGTTELTSIAYELEAGDAVSFQYWFNSTGDDNEFGVDYSSDNGSNWSRVRTYTNPAASWRSDSLVVGTDVAASSQARFRFTINDAGTQDVSEGGLDDLVITRFNCEPLVVPECSGDLNTTGTTNGIPDGTTNLSDLQFFLNAFQNDLGSSPGSAADLNTTGTTNGIPDGTVDLADLQFYLNLWQTGLSECP